MNYTRKSLSGKRINYIIKTNMPVPSASFWIGLAGVLTSAVRIVLWIVFAIVYSVNSIVK